MNNKGFTLIELLAVIVILSGIAVMATLGISSSLENRSVKECEEEIELAKNSAKIYFSLLGKNSGEDTVTIGTLKDEGYLTSDKVSKLDDGDYITISLEFYGTQCS